jgi:hypothetical protein
MHERQIEAGHNFGGHRLNHRVHGMEYARRPEGCGDAWGERGTRTIASRFSVLGKGGVVAKWEARIRGVDGCDAPIVKPLKAHHLHFNLIFAQEAPDVEDLQASRRMVITYATIAQRRGSSTSSMRTTCAVPPSAGRPRNA